MQKLLKTLVNVISFLFNIKNIKYYWSQVLIVIVPIILVLFPTLVDVISESRFWLIVFILSMVICVIFSLNISEDRLDQIKKVGELEHNINSLKAFLETTPERVIKSIYKYLDFGYHERITVYRYADSHFVPIGRYSKNIEYKKGGRKRYPYSEGFIGIAWNQGEFIVEDLPDPDKQNRSYIRDVRTKCNIDEVTISKMKMKSRSYYCVNLDNFKGDPVAVIVFESKNEKLPKNTKDIKHLLDSSFGHLIVDMINMNLPPGRRDV